MENSDFNRLRKNRDRMKLAVAWLLIGFYIPHIIFFKISKHHSDIVNDVVSNKQFLRLNMGIFNAFLYYIHTNRYFRTLFYHRIGTFFSLLVSWYLPGDRYFIISKTTQIMGGVILSHPYATIINADKIGYNFTCRNCTTIGEKENMNERPSIGENVSLGANVVIIGKISIGNNVIVGAGSVVVKDIPDNCVVGGNPAKIIKTL